MSTVIVIIHQFIYIRHTFLTYNNVQKCPTIFSKGLKESVDPSRPWNSSAQWLAGRTSLGVTGVVTAVKYSISYVSLLSTRHLGLTQCKLSNKAGRFLAPSLGATETVVTAGNGKFDTRFNADLVDSNGARSYPIVAYTYLVIRMKTMKNCDSAKELYRYIDWFTTSEEASYLCKENGMIPLSRNASDRIASGKYRVLCERLIHS